MQITITVEADTLDEALKKLFQGNITWRPAEKLVPEQPVFLSGYTQVSDGPYADTLGVAKLENLDDLKPEPVAPTVKDVVDALRNYIGVKGPDAGLSLLASFGVTQCSDIPEARRTEFIEAAKKVLS